MRRRVFEILNGSIESDRVSSAFSIFLAVLIALNVVAVLLETVATFQSAHGEALQLFELFSVIMFTVEYCLRIWCCVENQDYRDPISGRLRFVLTPLALIDLVAIFPFYLPKLVSLDLRMLRALRLIRIFRILRLGRYSSALSTLGRVIRSKKEELAITLFMVSVLLIIASSFMYFLEHDAQPEAFSSIPATLWWGIETLTTVGYGDVFPITPYGKVMGATIALLSIGIFALPTGIIGSGFMEEIQAQRNKNSHCPHCGAKLDK